jgi:hypothetical protein
MKIHTNVKAGTDSSPKNQGDQKITVNHNEKLADDNNGSIEHKKSARKKHLRLGKETVKELKDSDLKVGIAEPWCPPFYSYRNKVK